jgi:hypothetical protein
LGLAYGEQEPNLAEMTKISPEIEENMKGEVVFPVSADVSFASDGFPKYKLGPDNQILEEPKEDNKGPSLKEVVEQETTQLSDQHKRLSVRDLACKFDKNLTAAAKLAEEVLELCHFLYMALSIFFLIMHDTKSWMCTNEEYSSKIKHSLNLQLKSISCVYLT